VFGRAVLDMNNKSVLVFSAARRYARIYVSSGRKRGDAVVNLERRRSGRPSLICERRQRTRRKNAPDQETGRLLYPARGRHRRANCKPSRTERRKEATRVRAARSVSDVQSPSDTRERLHECAYTTNKCTRMTYPWWARLINPALHLPKVAPLPLPRLPTEFLDRGTSRVMIYGLKQSPRSQTLPVDA